MVNDILEPLKVYNSLLKDKVYENTVKYFENLTKSSKIDVEANKKTVTEYKKYLKVLEKCRKSLAGKITLKVFMIIGIVLFSLTAIFLFFANLELYIPIIVAIIVAGIDIAFIILICKVVNQKINSLKGEKDRLEQTIEKLKSVAYGQMAPLNELYDWNIPSYIINSANTIIKMDNHYDVSKYYQMNKFFGYKENTKDNVSTFYVQSGSILGNPFLICEDYIQSFVNHTYTGSITIHWTETVKTKDGWKTVHRSQVLSASVTKPKPIYTFDTYLVFGNDAAPNLKFSRIPTVTSNMDEKAIDKKVKKTAKKLDKKAKDELMDNDPKTNYTRFGNDEFETLFGGTNRNNELEYRLLFTPLAQKNLLGLLKSKQPYGDDFSFLKDKKINIVRSNHSQSFNYKCNPDIFIDFDYENAKKRFIDYNTKYFESFYFDLAPLISIPLYQQTKTIDYIYDKQYTSNVTSFEHESIANAFNKNVLKHENSVTDAILKTKLIEKQGNTDIVEITAHSFYTIKHTELIPRSGGDGKIHNVPVVWYEYLPLEKTTRMLIKKNSSSRYEHLNRINNETFKNVLSSISLGNNFLYERGLFASLIIRNVDESILESLNNVLNTTEVKNKTIKEQIKDQAHKVIDDAEKAKNI